MPDQSGPLGDLRSSPAPADLATRAADSAVARLLATTSSAWRSWSSTVPRNDSTSRRRTIRAARSARGRGRTAPRGRPDRPLPSAISSARRRPGSRPHRRRTAPCPAGARRRAARRARHSTGRRCDADADGTSCPDPSGRPGPSTFGGRCPPACGHRSEARPRHRPVADPDAPGSARSAACAPPMTPAAPRLWSDIPRSAARPRCGRPRRRGWPRTRSPLAGCRRATRSATCRSPRCRR